MTSNLTRTAAGVIAAGMIAAAAAPAIAADPTDAMLRAAAEISAEYDLPAGLLLAVAETESDFDPDCVTGKCRGLMQINSAYAREYAAQAGLDSWDLFDPEDSLRIGAALLAGYLDTYQGDLHFALMCYNLGEWGARAKRKDGVQTTSYSRKVVSKIERWSVAELVEVELFGNSEQLDDHIADDGKMAEQAGAIRECIHKWIREVLFR